MSRYQQLCDQYLNARGWEAESRALEQMSHNDIEKCVAESTQWMSQNYTYLFQDPAADWMDANPTLAVVLILAYLAIAAARSFPATKVALKNEMGHVVYAPRSGRFSWTVLFFGIFPPLFRGHWQASLIILACALFTYGLASLAFAFFYNQWFVARMVDRGYRIQEGMPKFETKPKEDPEINP